MSKIHCGAYRSYCWRTGVQTVSREEFIRLHREGKRSLCLNCKRKIPSGVLGEFGSASVQNQK